MLTLRGAEDENAGQNNEVISFWEDSEELCVTNKLQAFLYLCYPVNWLTNTVQALCTVDI